jgi:hypothetical protein
MAGSKVSELLASSALGDNDLLYVVNSGNPRKLTVSALTSHLVNNKGVVTTVNIQPLIAFLKAIVHSQS